VVARSKSASSPSASLPPLRPPAGPGPANWRIPAREKTFPFICPPQPFPWLEAALRCDKPLVSGDQQARRFFRPLNRAAFPPSPPIRVTQGGPEPFGFPPPC